MDVIFIYYLFILFLFDILLSFFLIIFKQSQETIMFQNAKIPSCDLTNKTATVVFKQLTYHLTWGDNKSCTCGNAFFFPCAHLALVRSRKNLEYQEVFRNEFLPGPIQKMYAEAPRYTVPDLNFDEDGPLMPFEKSATRKRGRPATHSRLRSGRSIFFIKFEFVIYQKNFLFSKRGN